MLTYQLQDRVLRLKKGPAPSFPSRAVIRLACDPPPVFGDGEGPVLFVLRGSGLSIIFDANTGRSYNTPKPALASLEVGCRWDDAVLSLTGRYARYEFECLDYPTLVERLLALHYLLPLLLSARLPQPVVITNTYCIVGESELNWELKEIVVPMVVRTKEELEEEILSAFSALPVICEPANRRLAAALHYLHAGRRLLIVGTSPWEFTAEAILSFNKALEVLFGERRDDQRKGLATLGYDSPTIEREFIPILLLRDWLDVAHPRLAVLRDTELEKLYRYLVRLEPTFAGLSDRLLRAAADGSFHPQPPGELALSPTEQRALDRLLAMVSPVAARADA